MDLYESEHVISKSGLDKINSSPLDYWWHYLREGRTPYIPNQKELFETAFRCAILTPRMFTEKYVKMPPINRATNIGKAEYKSLVDACFEKGQLLLDGDEFDSIVEMQKRCKEHPALQKLLKSGMVGQPARFEQIDTGAVISFLPHWITNRPDPIIVYLMSCSNAAQWWFLKEVENKKLHKRAAIQIDGLQYDNFVFITVERVAPYKIGVYHLDDRTIELGRSEYIKNCVTYMECMDSGKWTGLSQQIETISLPAYLFK